MKKLGLLGVLILIILSGFIFLKGSKERIVPQPEKQISYWLLLKRKSNKEYLYRGVPGDVAKSSLLKTFVVKSGIPGERPTPLPQLLGKEYWIITDKIEAHDNPETAPYFIILNIPVPSDFPFGPVPYTECGEQCNWELPGAFGLHGINGDTTRLSKENPGSSGCVRHTDEDITYLYNLLDPKKEETRYYIQDI